MNRDSLPPRTRQPARASASEPRGDDFAPPRGGTLAPALLAAALALPGVAPPAAAGNAPEQGQVDLRYLSYRDSQPGLKRVSVSAPSIGLRVPLAGSWSVETTGVYDSVSGASPRWHSAVSSASKMSDRRRAGDVKVTRYWERATLAVGGAVSSENDYKSRALSVQATRSSDDNNRTWAFGIGRSSDRIDPTNQVVVGERKRTTDLLIGVTQVLTPDDIVQVNATRARGSGYFSDPYKFPDNRPRERTQHTVLVRWNHHLASLASTLRLGWRYYRDDWKVASNTLTGEWVKPAGSGWTITPSLRLYSQRSARFYYDPVYDSTLGEPYPPGYLADPGGMRSPDARLSAFGAVTIGIRVAKAIDPSTTADVKVERYEQRGDWRVGGDGSPGLEPFRATILQVGLTRTF